MTGSHPFLDIHNIFDFSCLRCFSVVFLKNSFWLVMAFKIAPEMLEQSHLLLKLLGILSQSVFLADILTITRSSLHVIEMMSIWIKNDLCRVVEEHTSGIVREIVSQAILC